MTEAGNETTPEAELPAPPKRRLFFARLAAAIRRQDWFVVALEIAIVVLGVIIGFQVTAWGQARADAVKEQTYLRQLSADLRETLRLVNEADSLAAAGDRAAGRMIRMFYLPEPPPTDSVVRWHVESWSLPTVTPLLGTAEALISSGDLRLVRDDSLRTAITAYATRSIQLVDDQALHHAEWRRSVNDLMIRLGYHQALDYWTSDIDSSVVNDPRWPGVVGPRRDPFALDVDDLLGDRDAQTLLNRSLQSRLAIGGNRRAVKATTDTLLEKVGRGLRE